MYTIDSTPLAISFCVITMLGWGSWANTQKMAGKDQWPFPLFYWDYAFGVAIFSVLFMLAAGRDAIGNLGQADGGAVMHAIASGVIFNVSNLLLVVAIDAAGMAVAFPVGVGLALVIGTAASYLQAPRGNATLLAAGVALVVMAMVLSAIARSALPGSSGTGWRRGVVFAVIAGCLMGYFYPQLSKSISPGFEKGEIQSGYLTPYAALLLFSLGLLASNVVVNTISLRAAGLRYAHYFSGSFRLHALGLAGGMIWMLALSLNVLASGVAGPAISYALGQGATLVAAIWGVFVWKEFRGAPRATVYQLGFMFAAYAAGLILIGTATLGA